MVRVAGFVSFVICRSSLCLVVFLCLTSAVLADTAPNRRILKRYLMKLLVPAANIQEFTDGKQAFDFIVGGGTCDLMFMDIEMPHMNGDQVMARTQPPFPVVAVTANAAVEDRARYITGGFHDVLTKPFDNVGVKAMITSVLGPPASGFVILDE